MRYNMAKLTKKHPGNDPVGVEEKKLLEKQERQGLVFGADALLPKKSIDKELEIHQLRSGVQFTIKGVKDVINELAGPYSPMFPNSKPFFN